MPETEREPLTTQLFEPLPSFVPRSSAQRCRSAPICSRTEASKPVGDSPTGAAEVLTAAPRYTPSSRYSLARSAVAAGCSPGYGGSNSHKALVSMLCSADRRANSLPQLPPRSSAIMSDQPTLSSGSQ